MPTHTNDAIHMVNIQDNSDAGFSGIAENRTEKSMVKELPNGEPMSIMNTGANPQESRLPSGEAQLTPKA